MRSSQVRADESCRSGVHLCLLDMNPYTIRCANCRWFRWTASPRPL